MKHLPVIVLLSGKYPRRRQLRTRRRIGGLWLYRRFRKN
jgi:hypothetical protein